MTESHSAVKIVSAPIETAEKEITAELGKKKHSKILTSQIVPGKKEVRADTTELKKQLKSQQATLKKLQSIPPKKQTKPGPADQTEEAQPTEEEKKKNSEQIDKIQNDIKITQKEIINPNSSTTEDCLIMVATIVISNP